MQRGEEADLPGPVPSGGAGAGPGKAVQSGKPVSGTFSGSCGRFFAGLVGEVNWPVWKNPMMMRFFRGLKKNI